MGFWFGKGVRWKEGVVNELDLSLALRLGREGKREGILRGPGAEK